MLSTEALEDDERGDDVMDPRPWHGAYGAPSLKVTTLAGEAVTLLGGEGSWIIGHALAIGGAGYASVTRIGSPGALQPAEGGARIGIGYGGVRLGGIVGTRRLTHLTFGILVGAGSATSATASGSFHRADGVFVAEPDVGTEINLARHFRVGVVGSYRFIGSTDIAGFTPTRLSGPAAAVTLRFGAF